MNGVRGFGQGFVGGGARWWKDRKRAGREGSDVGGMGRGLDTDGEE